MHINTWVHEYGEKKTRVFATTIGHHNITMEHPDYQRMLTRGLLWAAGRNVDAIYKD
jgi:type 1 glutamine amidotransferase